MNLKAKKIFKNLREVVESKQDIDWYDEHKVDILYTAPTAIRSLMGFGLKPFEGKDLSTLKVLGTVGEPINEEAWHWYDENVGKKRCPVVDTWWQTETGTILITPLPGAIPTKPGSATLVAIVAIRRIGENSVRPARA